jgi:hypothetical protein
MLIVFQRPDATAVTGIEAWNKKLNRTVNVGSKRIMVMDDYKKYAFKNVFDVSDTHKRNPNGPDFKLWNVWKVPGMRLKSPFPRNRNIIDYNRLPTSLKRVKYDSQRRTIRSFPGNPVQ